MNFQIEKIDHIEVTVPDRYEAAKWYQETLGFGIIPEFEFWAENPHGPLMIGTTHRETKLALFAGPAVESQQKLGFHLVAFCTDAKNFVEFVSRLPQMQLRDLQGQVLDANSVADHEVAFSIYFCDPYGNQLELTTYEYQQTESLLNP